MEENLKKEIVSFFEHQILVYGFLPLLTSLEYFEEKENYEVCNCILLALKNHSKTFNFWIPTRYDERAVILLKNNFKRIEYSGETALKNNQHYSDEILSNFNLKLKKALSFKKP